MATFRPTALDLLLAVVLAIVIPFAAAALLTRTGGALLPLALYYGVACLVVPLWRRGALGYGRPRRWPWELFLPALLLPFALAALDWPNRVLPGTSAAAATATSGVLLTALIWAPLNALLEQVGWFYVLDAWRLRWQTGLPRIAGTVVGILLTLAFIALIHILFWAKFLPAGSEAGGTLLLVGQALNLLLIVAYWWLWQRSGSLWPTFVIHLLVDLQLVLIPWYSILPDL